MITDINSVVNLSANDQVELDIKYTNSNKNIQAGDEVNIDLLLIISPFILSSFYTNIFFSSTNYPIFLFFTPN